MRDKWAFKYLNFGTSKKKPTIVKPVKKSKTKKPKESKKYVQHSEYNDEENKKKAEVITQIQCRWWYAIPLWPEESKDYSKDIEEKNLREVNPADWIIEPQFNEFGKEKVKGLTGYPGIFMNFKGRLFDFRDKSTCPSVYTLMEMPLSELETILLTAYQNQLSVLKAQPEYDEALALSLEQSVKDMIRKMEEEVVEEEQKEMEVEKEASSDMEQMDPSSL